MTIPPGIPGVGETLSAVAPILVSVPIGASDPFVSFLHTQLDQTPSPPALVPVSAVPPTPATGAAPAPESEIAGTGTPASAPSEPLPAVTTALSAGSFAASRRIAGPESPAPVAPAIASTTAVPTSAAPKQSAATTDTVVIPGTGTKNGTTVAPMPSAPPRARGGGGVGARAGAGADANPSDSTAAPPSPVQPGVANPAPAVATARASRLATSLASTPAGMETLPGATELAAVSSPSVESAPAPASGSPNPRSGAAKVSTREARTFAPPSRTTLDTSVAAPRPQITAPKAPALVPAAADAVRAVVESVTLGTPKAPAVAFVSAPAPAPTSAPASAPVPAAVPAFVSKGNTAPVSVAAAAVVTPVAEVAVEGAPVPTPSLPPQASKPTGVRMPESIAIPASEPSIEKPATEFTAVTGFVEIFSPEAPAAPAAPAPAPASEFASPSTPETSPVSSAEYPISEASVQPKVESKETRSTLDFSSQPRVATPTPNSTPASIPVPLPAPTASTAPVVEQPSNSSAPAVPSLVRPDSTESIEPPAANRVENKPSVVVAAEPVAVAVGAPSVSNPEPSLAEPIVRAESMRSASTEMPPPSRDEAIAQGPVGRRPEAEIPTAILPQASIPNQPPIASPIVPKSSPRVDTQASSSQAPQSPEVAESVTLPAADPVVTQARAMNVPAAPMNEAAPRTERIAPEVIEPSTPEPVSNSEAPVQEAPFLKPSVVAWPATAEVQPMRTEPVSTGAMKFTPSRDAAVIAPREAQVQEPAPVTPSIASPVEPAKVERSHAAVARPVSSKSPEAPVADSTPSGSEPVSTPVSMAPEAAGAASAPSALDTATLLAAAGWNPSPIAPPAPVLVPVALNGAAETHESGVTPDPFASLPTARGAAKEQGARKFVRTESKAPSFDGGSGSSSGESAPGAFAPQLGAEMSRSADGAPQQATREPSRSSSAVPTATPGAVALPGFQAVEPTLVSESAVSQARDPGLAQSMKPMRNASAAESSLPPSPSPAGNPVESPLDHEAVAPRFEVVQPWTRQSSAPSSQTKADNISFETTAPTQPELPMEPAPARPEAVRSETPRDAKVVSEQPLANSALPSIETPNPASTEVMEMRRESAPEASVQRDELRPADQQTLQPKWTGVIPEAPKESTAIRGETPANKPVVVPRSEVLTPEPAVAAASVFNPSASTAQAPDASVKPGVSRSVETDLPSAKPSDSRPVVAANQEAAPSKSDSLPANSKQEAKPAPAPANEPARRLGVTAGQGKDASPRVSSAAESVVAPRMSAAPTEIPATEQQVSKPVQMRPTLEASIQAPISHSESPAETVSVPSHGNAAVSSALRQEVSDDAQSFVKPEAAMTDSGLTAPRQGAVQTESTEQFTVPAQQTQLAQPTVVSSASHEAVIPNLVPAADANPERESSVRVESKQPREVTREPAMPQPGVAAETFVAPEVQPKAVQSPVVDSVPQRESILATVTREQPVSTPAPTAKASVEKESLVRVESKLQREISNQPATVPPGVVAKKFTAPEAQPKAVVATMNREPVVSEFVPAPEANAKSESPVWVESKQPREVTREPAMVQPEIVAEKFVAPEPEAKRVQLPVVDSMPQRDSVSAAGTREEAVSIPTPTPTAVAKENAESEVPVRVESKQSHEVGREPAMVQSGVVAEKFVAPEPEAKRVQPPVVDSLPQRDSVSAAVTRGEAVSIPTPTPTSAAKENAESEVPVRVESKQSREVTREPAMAQFAVVAEKFVAPEAEAKRVQSPLVDALPQRESVKTTTTREEVVSTPVPAAKTSPESESPVHVESKQPRQVSREPAMVQPEIVAEKFVAPEPQAKRVQSPVVDSMPQRESVSASVTRDEAVSIPTPTLTSKENAESKSPVRVESKQPSEVNREPAIAQGEAESRVAEPKRPSDSKAQVVASASEEKRTLEFVTLPRSELPTAHAGIQTASRMAVSREEISGAAPKQDASKRSETDWVSERGAEVKPQTIQPHAGLEVPSSSTALVESPDPESIVSARDNEQDSNRAACAPTVPPSSSSSQAPSRPNAASESLTDSDAASVEQSLLALPSNLTFRSTASSPSTLEASTGDAKNLSTAVSVSEKENSTESIPTLPSAQKVVPEQESAAPSSRAIETTQPEAIAAADSSSGPLVASSVESTPRGSTTAVEPRTSKSQPTRVEIEPPRSQLQSMPADRPANPALKSAEDRTTSSVPVQRSEVGTPMETLAAIVVPRISSAPMPTPFLPELDASPEVSLPTVSAKVNHPSFQAPLIPSSVISSALMSTPTVGVEQPVLPASHPSVDAPRAEVVLQRKTAVDFGAPSIASNPAPEAPNSGELERREIAVGTAPRESHPAALSESEPQSSSEFEGKSRPNVSSFVASSVPSKAFLPETEIVTQVVAGKTSAETVVAGDRETVRTGAKAERVGNEGRAVEAPTEFVPRRSEVSGGLPSEPPADVAVRSPEHHPVASRAEAPLSRAEAPEVVPQNMPALRSEVVSAVATPDRAQANVSANVASPSRCEVAAVNGGSESVETAPQSRSTVKPEEMVDRPFQPGRVRTNESEREILSAVPALASRSAISNDAIAAPATAPASASARVTQPEIAVQSPEPKTDRDGMDIGTNPRSEVEARPEFVERQTARNLPTGNSLPSPSAEFPVNEEREVGSVTVPLVEASREDGVAPSVPAAVSRLTPDMMANPAFGAMMTLVPALPPVASASGAVASRTVEGRALAAVSGTAARSAGPVIESDSESESETITGSASARGFVTESVVPNQATEARTGGEGDSDRGDSRDSRRETALPALESERSFEVPATATATATATAAAPVSTEPVLKRTAKPSAVRVESDLLGAVRFASSRFVEPNRSESKGSTARHPLETRDLELGMPAAFRAVDMAHEPTTDKFAGNTAQGLPGETSPRGTSAPDVDRSLKLAAAAASSGAVAPSRLEMPTRSESVGLSHGDRVQETVDRLQTMMSAHASSVVAGHSDELRAVLRPDAGTEIHLHVRREADRIEMTAHCQGSDVASWQASWSDLQQRMRAQGVVLQPLEVGGRGTGSNTGFGTGTDSDRPRSQGGASGSDDRDSARRDSSSGRRPTLEQAPQETVSRRPSRRVTPRVAEYWA